MRRNLVLVAAGALLLSGCGIELPSYHLSKYTEKQLLGAAAQDAEAEVVLPVAIRDRMDEILWTNFSPPWFWDEASLSDPLAKQVHKGAELYRLHCIHCHGLEGGGDGPTAEFLYPRPRDYRRGTFKWKSTTRGAKPTKEDLNRLISEGALGTSMPPFVLMPENDRRDLVEYVIYLSKRGELERRMLLYLATEAPPADQLESDAAAMTETLEILNETATDSLAQIEQQWAEADSTVVRPDESRPVLQHGTPEHLASLKRGKELYLSEKASCYKCHSRDGKAKDIAPSEKDKMVDDWGNPNFPRNLTLGLYRGGRRPVDLYRRVHQGILGAAMPEGGKNLKPDEIWDLVTFVQALPYQPELLQDAQNQPVGQTASQGH